MTVQTQTKYVRRNPTLTKCVKCGGRIFRTRDYRKYACINCGKGFSEPITMNGRIIESNTKR